MKLNISNKKRNLKHPHIIEIKHHASGTSLAIQQLGLCPDTVGVTGSTPCWGMGTPRHTAQPEENKKIQKKLDTILTWMNKNIAYQNMGDTVN